MSKESRQYTVGRLAGAGMAGLAPITPAFVEHNPNFGQLPGGERGQNGPMAAGWQTGTEQVVGNTRDKGHHAQARADLVTQRNEAQVINQIEPERHQRIKLIDDGNTGGRYHRVDLPPSLGTEIPRVDDELLNARAEARFSRYTEREMMDRAGGMVGGLADVWSSHLPHNSVLLDMVDAFDYGYVNGDNAADWFGGVAQELVGSVDTMIGKANLNPQQLGQLAKLENISALPPEFGLQGLRDQLTKAEFQQVKAQVELVNARLEQGVTDIGQLVEKTAQRLPDGAGAIAAFSLINIAIAAAEYKRSGSARNATLLLFAGNLLLLTACGGVVTPEPGVTPQAAEVMPTHTPMAPEPGVTPTFDASVNPNGPTFKELVDRLMGAPTDAQQLEKVKIDNVAALGDLFFYTLVDTNQDRKPDGTILSEMGDSVPMWAIDGQTPYLTGPGINAQFGNGTKTVAMVSGFEAGQPFFGSLGGAQEAINNQGLDITLADLHVIDATHIQAVDSNGVVWVELNASGGWSVVEVEATATATAEATEEPTSTPEPTPISQVELGSTRLNPDTQITEVYVGNDTYLEAPAHFKSEFVHTDEQGRVRYDSPGLHLYVNESNEWQVLPFEEVEFDGMQVVYGAGGEYQITSDTTKAEERKREFFVSWVQAEANDEYRQEIYGTTTPTDEQVWEHLTMNGLQVIDKLKIAFADNEISFINLIRFAKNLQGTSISVADLGLVLEYNSDLENGQYELKESLQLLTKISGNYANYYEPSYFAVDGNGRLYFISLNGNVPEDQIKYVQEEHIPGGLDGSPKPWDKLRFTQQFETLVNINRMWNSTHSDGGNSWIWTYLYTVDEYKRSGGASGTDGSYGAYQNQIEDIYGSDNFLVETSQ